MSEFYDAINEASSRIARNQAAALDKTIADYLFTRDIDTSLFSNGVLTEGTLDLMALKKVIEDLRPPVMLMHPADYARCQDAADRAGFSDVPGWMLHRGMSAEVVVSPYVLEGQALISNPRLGPEIADS